MQFDNREMSSLVFSIDLSFQCSVFSPTFKIHDRIIGGQNNRMQIHAREILSSPPLFSLYFSGTKQITLINRVRPKHQG